MKYHILNGDALKSQFPKEIEGEIIVMRECLIDGSVKGDTLKEFYQNRASFLHKAYSVSKEEYQARSVSQFEQIKSIESDAEVFLWFEDDLFCQVNFWFVCSLLKSSQSVYLIRPNKHTQYGFGGLNQDELLALQNHQIHIENIDDFTELWNLYKTDASDKLNDKANHLESQYPFVKYAVNAYITTISIDGKSDLDLIILNLVKELETKNFKLIFKAFSQRYPMYGYGDLQFERILKRLGIG